MLRRQRATSCADTVFQNLLPCFSDVEGHGQDGGYSAGDRTGGETVGEGVSVVLAALGPAPLATRGAITVEFPTSSALAGVG